MVINDAPAGATPKTMEKAKLRINKATRRALLVEWAEAFQARAVFDKLVPIALKFGFESKALSDFLRRRWMK